MMHLQRQLGAGVHGKALDLVARAGVDAFVGSPGAVHPPVGGVLGALVGLHPVDQQLDVLRRALARHQHRVGGLDDHQALDADRGDHAVLGLDVGVGDVGHEHVAFADVAVGGLVVELPECVPRTDIAPPHLHRNNGTQSGLFHHRIVDGNRGAGRERSLVQAAEVQVHAARRQRLPCRGEHGRLELLQLLDIGRGAQHEHAAVPEVVAGCDEAPGIGKIRLLDELPDRVGVLEARHRGPAADVAVAGFGAVGDDAEGGQESLVGGGGRRRDGAVERGRVLDHVIGRQHQQQRGRVGFGKLHGGGGHGGCRIPADRFEQQQLRRDADGAQLFGDQKPVFLVADHDRCLDARGALQAQHRLLQHRVLRGQAQKLLRIGAARQRPEAGAGATAQDDGRDGHGGFQVRGQRAVVAETHDRTASW